MLNPFVPQSLICRDVELEQVCTLLQQDSDFVVTGVTGIGRRTLIRSAAAQVEAGNGVLVRHPAREAQRVHDGFLVAGVVPEAGPAEGGAKRQSATRARVSCQAGRSASRQACSPTLAVSVLPIANTTPAKWLPKLSRNCGSMPS